MKNKKQILMIHGGNTFKKRKDYLKYLKTRKVSLENKNSWSGKYFDQELGKKFQIIRPRMPLQDNAKYQDWKIWFERHITYLKNDVILIGGSLGGIFLVKYLSEHKFPKKIKALFLIAPPFDNKDSKVFLADFVFKSSNLKKIEKQCSQIYIYHSEDDLVVPFADFKKYKKYLLKTNFISFKKRGHFKIKKFPEIIKIIKKLK